MNSAVELLAIAGGIAGNEILTTVRFAWASIIPLLMANGRSKIWAGQAPWAPGVGLTLGSVGGAVPSGAGVGAGSSARARPAEASSAVMEAAAKTNRFID